MAEEMEEKDWQQPSIDDTLLPPKGLYAIYAESMAPNGSNGICVNTYISMMLLVDSQMRVIEL